MSKAFNYLCQCATLLRKLLAFHPIVYILDAVQLQCFVNQVSIELVKLVLDLRFDFIVHCGHAGALLVRYLFVELIDF